MSQNRAIPREGLTQQAFTRLVREILADSTDQDATVLLQHPEAALTATLDQLQRERAGHDRAVEELRALCTSRSVRLAYVFRRWRHAVAPAGSLRARAARRLWWLLRSTGAGSLARDAAATSVAPAERQAIPGGAGLIERQVQALRERCLAGQELFIFLPSIPWTVHLFQRPQHLARGLARAGRLVVYDCSGTNEDIVGLVEREPNLFLYKGDPYYLTTLPDPVLWAFTYNYSQRELYPRNCRVVYDWIDDLSVFPYDQEMLRRCHERALREATVVVSVARKLHAAAVRARPDAIYVPNAVDFDHFARPAAEADDPTLCRLRAEGKPVAGYYGALASWFDYQLLAAVAARRPDWNFLLIGPDYDGSLPGQPLLHQRNVCWIGPRPYHQLPAYLQAMTCALIPFQLNNITLATSPLKLYEYLAGGKPVITTAMPECQAHPEVRIVHDVPDFAAALDEARRDAEDPGRREAYRAVGRVNSWETRTRTALRRLESLRQVEGLETSVNRGFFRALTGFFDHAAESDCYRLHFEYALTTNERGAYVAKTLAQHVNLAGKDYLDVGCAYGGFLAAFAERGARVQGLDLDAGLLNLARANLAEQNVEAELFHLDATRPEVGKRFRRSKDVITCNDVIEHVDDPQALMDNIAGMLRPGGWLYLEIPNKDYAPYVVEDGHFRLFGITLLERDEAKVYHAALHPETVYGVGHYLTLEQYRTMLEERGLTVLLLERCVEWSSVEEVLKTVKVLENEGETRLAKTPTAVREKVGTRLRAYLRGLNATPRETANQRRDFLIRYGVSFWHLLAHLAPS